MARRFAGVLLMAAAFSVLTHWVAEEPPLLLPLFLALFVPGIWLVAVPSDRWPADTQTARLATDTSHDQLPKPPKERKVFRYRSVRPAIVALLWMLLAWGISWVEAIRTGEYVVAIYFGLVWLGTASYLILVGWIQGKIRLICAPEGLILERIRGRVRLPWDEVDSLSVITLPLREAPRGSVFRVDGGGRSITFHGGLEAVEELAACIALATGLRWQSKDAGSGG